MIAITGIGDWTLLAWISSLATTASALLARPRRPHDSNYEIRELILRERHPFRWAVKHPAKAIERLFR